MGSMSIVLYFVFMFRNLLLVDLQFTMKNAEVIPGNLQNTNFWKDVCKDDRRSESIKSVSYPLPVVKIAKRKASLEHQ